MGVHPSITSHGYLLNDLGEEFIKYLLSRHKNYEMHVVFDGYAFDLSTKVPKQHQRSNSGKVSTDVKIAADGSTCVPVKKEGVPA